MMKKACKLMKEKAGFPDIHEMKYEYIGGKYIYHSNKSSDLTVMRQVLEDIHNQNHSLQEQISSL